MPTAVVDRPHSRATDSRSTARTTTTVRPTPPTAPAELPGRPAAVRRRIASDVEPATPTCASRPELFLDAALEQEPVTSAPARVRRHYAGLAQDATEVCASCPLLTACLYRAVVELDVAGFVAGTTERQRAEVRARLGVRVEPEDFDSLAGVVGGQRAVDHDEVVRLRRAHPDESLERIARRLGCSLSTVKRHLRRERTQPSAQVASPKPRPTESQGRRTAADVLGGTGSRRAAA